MPSHNLVKTFLIEMIVTIALLIIALLTLSSMYENIIIVVSPYYSFDFFIEMRKVA